MNDSDRYRAVWRYGLLGGVAALLVAVVAPWLMMWPIPLAVAVSALLGVEAWALWQLRNLLSDGTNDERPD